MKNKENVVRFSSNVRRCRNVVTLFSVFSNFFVMLFLQHQRHPAGQLRQRGGHALRGLQVRGDGHHRQHRHRTISEGNFIVKVLWKYFDKGSSYSGPLSTWSKCTRGGTWAAPMGYTKCQILQLIFNLGVLNYQKVDDCWS